VQAKLAKACVSRAVVTGIGECIEDNSSRLVVLFCFWQADYQVNDLKVIMGGAVNKIYSPGNDISVTPSVFERK